MWTSASALLLCRNCERYEVQLPHLRSARTFNGLKLCFRNSALSLLQKIWSSSFHTSARPGLRRSPALVLPGLPNMGVYFRISSLPGLPKMWSSASALLLCLVCQRTEVPLSIFPLSQDFERSRSSSTLVLPGLPIMDKSSSAFHLYRDFKRCEVPLPHLCSALTANVMKFSFRTSALPGLLMVWSFASAIPLCLYPQRSEVPLSILPLGQDCEDLVHLPHLDFQIWVRPLPHFISLSGLPKMWSSASAFLLCLDCQRSEVPLYVLPLGQDFVHLPHLFCQEFQIWISPISHFISAGTSKDLKFRFCTFALPCLPKMWSSASSVPMYVLIMYSTHIRTVLVLEKRVR